MPRRKKKETSVELGYAEEMDEVGYLAPHFFPSKIGGKPAWLVHDPLPADLSCGVCSHPMVFLLQVYAPLSPPAKGASEETFHRSLFVFICPDPGCCQPNASKNVKVFRSQIPRKNNFYPFDPLDPDLTVGSDLAKIEGLSLLENVCLCMVCGAKGKEKCDKCGTLDYCSVEHREWHWKKHHHHECGKTPEQIAALKRQQEKDRKRPASTEKTCDFNFPVFELVTEKEVYSGKTEPERSENDRLAEYNEFVRKSGLDDKENSASAVDLAELDDFQAKDKVFKNFSRRVAANPEQVLRYDRSNETAESLAENRDDRAKTARKTVENERKSSKNFENSPKMGHKVPEGPLWATPIVPESIPSCGLCGGPRGFEFQLMPHLLSVLDVDSFDKSIDFATIAIYTCEKSCTLGGMGYAEEYVWKQDYA